MTPNNPRDGLFYESYIVAQQLLNEGRMEEKDFSPFIIYNVMLDDLSDVPISRNPADQLIEFMFDVDEFAHRVREVATEFLQWAVPESFRAVDQGLITFEQAQQQVVEMTGELMSDDLVRRVRDHAEEFIAEIAPFSRDEAVASVLFGCHPQTLRDAGLDAILDDVADNYHKES